MMIGRHIAPKAGVDTSGVDTKFEEAGGITPRMLHRQEICQQNQ
jgi:hypothetical protein